MTKNSVRQSTLSTPISTDEWVVAYASTPTLPSPTVTLNTGLIQARCFNYPNILKGNFMNKDQVKGAVKNAAGKVQEAAGKMVDSKSQEIKGATLQAEGKTQKGYGDAKEVVKDARHATADALKSHS
jgi:uncharacterized protein YjbJ (UPF0337 family)